VKKGETKMPGASRGKVLLIPLLALLAVVALYPWETNVVPEWRVRIVDQSGTPLAHTGVREVWRHYSIESRGHEEDLRTDQNGYVTFPKRTIRAALAARIIRSLIHALTPHDSSGPVASVIVLAPEYDTWSHNASVPGEPLPKEIVVKKNR
jgi:hypothetical protein